MVRKLLHLAVLLSLFGLTANGYAGARESKGNLVFVNDYNFIELLQQHGLAPKSIGKRQVFLLIRLGASYADITACAAPEADAKALAQDLGRAAHLDDAQYSQEDDYAAATVSISDGKLFSHEHEWDFDLGSVIRSLDADGWKMFGGVKIAKDVVNAVSAEPVATFSGNRTYALEPLLDKPIHLEAHLNRAMYVLPFLVAFGPLTAMIFGFAVGIIISRRRDIELARRRKLYSAFVRYPLFGTIAVCLPLSMIAILGGFMMPFADLWFGQPSVGSALIPFIFITMPLPFLALIPMIRVENRLFSDGADKLDFKPAQVVSISKVSRGRVLSIGFVFIAAGIGLSLYSISMPRKNVSHVFVQLAGYALMFLAMPIAGKIVALWNPEQLAAESGDPLMARVVRLAASAMCPLAGVDVVEPRDQSQTVSIQFLNGRLMINREAINKLSDSALDFGMAYSMATKMYRMMLSIFLLVIPLSGFYAFIFMHWVRDHLAVEQRSIVSLATFPAMVVIIFPFMHWLTRRESRRQIRDTLNIVPDRAAGVEWIEASMQQPKAAMNPRGWEKRKKQILDQLDQISTEMGLG